MANPLKTIMPSIYEHQGIWRGTYQHVDLAGKVIDQHASQVECVFPDSGEQVYIQNNSFTWDDGRTHLVSFGGVLQGDQIYWDTDTFRGYGWVASPTVFLLELERKDLPGASFTEAIIMGSEKTSRARTWHWFKDGKCYQRTLCNEHLVKP